MADRESSFPFENLPEALVEDMLDQSDTLSNSLSSYFDDLQTATEAAREELRNKDLLHHENEVIHTVSHPTSCGIDGAYAVERLLATDIVAVAGLAIEGLTPPSEESFWPLPRHRSSVITAEHSDRTETVTRALMTAMELRLAANAPHNIVFLDGSLLSPAISLNQAMQAREDVDAELRATYDDHLDAALEAYVTVLEAAQTDQAFVSVPKYTTQQELSERLDADESYEDRALLSFLLEPGEFVGPLPLESSHVPRQVDQPPLAERPQAEQIDRLLQQQDILYYRPYGHSPAFRLELARSVTRNDKRLAKVLEAVQIQSGVSNVLEPYPLYITDRMVKEISNALPAIRKAVTQNIAADWDHDQEEMYLAMHGYRTEIGYGQ